MVSGVLGVGLTGLFMGGEEIMRELAFERMVEKGLEDSRKGKTIGNEEMEQRIRSWQR